MTDKQTPQGDLNSKWIAAVSAVAVPLLTLSIGGLTSWLMKLDDRQYVINQNYVSKAELKASIDNLGVLIEERRKQQEEADSEILNEIRATNATVQKLAITLERRTKE